MTDHAEEQEMEAEALEAIFDSQFSRKSPSEWSITLFPTLDEENHVACQLDIELPTEYPESLPQLNITLLQGLAEATHKPILQQLAEETAAQNEGLPAIYAIAETIKDWLVAHNRPGLDDTSMHAQMMLRTQEVSHTIPIMWCAYTPIFCATPFHKIHRTRCAMNAHVLFSGRLSF